MAEREALMLDTDLMALRKHMAENPNAVIETVAR
ncbi:MAG: heme utilization cystosolic carrier protein HutX, partial [Caulobacteraceae bacterium]